MMDEMAKSGRNAFIEARIVVGDNVEIKIIGGQSSPTQSESSPKGTSREKRDEQVI